MMKERIGNKHKKDSGRLLVQAAWTALTNGYLYGFISGKIYKGPGKYLCVPGLNCYSCPGALGSCPIGALQAVVTARKFQLSCYVFGLLMLFGSVFGRFVCGWLCPFGLVQDLLYRVPTPTKLPVLKKLLKKRRSLPGEGYLRMVKYVVLALLVLILPAVIVNIVGIGKPWFCQYVCPSGTLMGGIPLLITNPELRKAAGWLFSWKMGLLLATVILSIKLPRPFCRYICPLGAIYGAFNPISMFRLRIDESACITCGKCQKACPMDIEVWKKPNSAECIRCGACAGECPVGAIERCGLWRRKKAGAFRAVCHFKQEYH